LVSSWVTRLVAVAADRFAVERGDQEHPGRWPHLLRFGRVEPGGEAPDACGSPGYRAANRDRSTGELMCRGRFPLLEFGVVWFATVSVIDQDLA
jgi:hypothetical protein